MQGVKVGNLIFFSGQVAITPDGNLVPGGMMEQGEQAFKNLQRALTAGGASMASVVEVTLFVTNMDTGLEATNTYAPEACMPPAAVHLMMKQHGARRLRDKYFPKQPYPAVSARSPCMHAGVAVSVLKLPLRALQCTLVEVKGLYCPEALIEVKAIAHVL